MAQPPYSAGGEQGSVGETPSSDAASRRCAMEEGQGTLQDPRPTQDRQRPGRRDCCGRQKGGNETVNTVVAMTKWFRENYPIASVSNLHCMGIGGVPSTCS